MVLVIASAVVITVLVVRPDAGGGGSATPTTGASEFASAGDVGPVNIITEDPTCAPWGAVGNGLANVEKSVNWAERNKDAPASAWSSEQRSTHETVSKAMISAAMQTVVLAKQTPHRVIRELYTQLYVYAYEFEKSLGHSSAQDSYLPELVDEIGSVLTNVCASIEYEVAAAQAPFVPDGPTPRNVQQPVDPTTATRFLSVVDSVCSEWSDTFDKFDAKTADWRELNSPVPASQWTADQRSRGESAAQDMTANADALATMGNSTDNAVLRDFALLAGQYRRAYAHAIPSFTPADNYLANASTNLARIVNSGCSAVA